MPDNDYEKFRRKLMFEQVSKAIKENPKNWANGLEDLGFHWFDDEDDPEEVEESLAKPENLDQELLVAYFEGTVMLSDKVFNTYLVPERKPSSGTILDFGLRILDSKKKTISVR